MKSEVANVVTGIKDLTTSGKLNVTPYLSEVYVRCLTRDKKEYKIDREYITQNQPWSSDTHSREYFPHSARKWYPPIFCFGVALSSEETAELVRRLEIPAQWAGLDEQVGSGVDLPFLS